MGDMRGGNRKTWALPDIHPSDSSRIQAISSVWPNKWCSDFCYDFPMSAKRTTHPTENYSLLALARK